MSGPDRSGVAGHLEALALWGEPASFSGHASLTCYKYKEKADHFFSSSPILLFGLYSLCSLILSYTHTHTHNHCSSNLDPKPITRSNTC